MKWVEIIKLRSAGIEQDLLEEFLRSLAKSGQSSELLEIKTYRHAALQRDFSVHLYWKSERAEENGTNLGLHVVETFKEFGLIDHSVWIEEKR